MITNYLLVVLEGIAFSFVDYIPQFGMPGFWSSYVPEILIKVYDFNDYLPVWEAMFTVIFCLTCTVIWKIAKIVLSFVNINMNA